MIGDAHARLRARTRYYVYAWTCAATRFADTSSSSSTPATTCANPQHSRASHSRDADAATRCE